MKQFYLALFIFLFSLEAFTQEIFVSGEVSGSWTSGTVYVVGDITIPQGQALTISPSTSVLFTGHYVFNVSGKLIAVGGPCGHISFDVTDTSGFMNPDIPDGGWGGIHFDQTSSPNDTSCFKYCYFAHGKAVGDSINRFGGAVCIRNFNNVSFNRCTFDNNYAYHRGGAIFASYADIDVQNCQFRYNRAMNPGPDVWGYGGAFFCEYSQPSLLNNSFSFNSSTGVGGGAAFENSDPLLDANIFDNNLSALGGGLGIIRSTPTHVITNNLVINNEAIYFGGGIAFLHASPVVANNTIADNRSMYGGGLYFNDAASPTFYNTIIWGNKTDTLSEGPSMFIFEITSAPVFYYCDIQYDTVGIGGSGVPGKYLYNIDIFPGFDTLGFDPYALVSGSPCVNGGSPDTTGLQLPLYDIVGNPRLYDGRIDMGAYEYPLPVGLPSVSRPMSGTLVYPNPFSDNLTFEADVQGRISIEIYDVSGQTIVQINKNSTAGKQTMTWDGRDMAGNEVKRGIYFYRIFNQGKPVGEGTVVRK